MDWGVRVTKEFEKDLNKLNNSLKQIIKKKINKLKNQPFLGKPLGFNYFREQKVKGYRNLFL